MPALWYLDPVALLVALLAMAGVAIPVVAIWSRWRRLTWPETPRSRHALAGRLARRPNRFEEETEADQWGAVHDGLLPRRLGRLGGRFAASAARLGSALPLLQLAAEQHLARRSPTARTRRRLMPPAADWVLGAITLRADYAIGTTVVGAAAPLLDEDRAELVAIAIAISYFVCGRLVADGLLHRRWGRVWGGSAALIAFAMTAASFQDYWKAQWFLLALAPAIVALVATLLAHPEPAEVALAIERERVAHRRFRRALRRVARHHARSARLATRLAYAAHPGLVARPRAVGFGQPAPGADIDIRRTLERFGLSHQLDLVDDAHRQLHELSTTGSTERRHLRSA